MASFSLMIGTAPSAEQAGQRAAGVEVLPPVDEVVGHEQRLGRHEAVGAEGGVPAAHQPRLAGRRQRLQRRHVGRPGGEPEGGDAGGDGAGRHDDHLVTAGPQLGDLAGQLADRAVVDRAPRRR